ncbi:MAG: hypothetical protein NDP13_03950 [Crenarchaeota archaeon]|nr:hypothetical protein [Thermoproteota archaeon]MCR8501243.1 hypothetical protein [Thermoproteota archaeon]
MDPCLSFVKMARKNLGIFKKNPWTAALFFIQASECYLNANDKRRAFQYAYQAANLLEKYWGKGKNDVVLSDLEKAFGLILKTNPRRIKEIKGRAFKIYLYHAGKLENSGNFLAASEKYEAAMQFAPSGEKAKEVLLKAIAVLQKAKEKESVIRNRALLEKIDSRLEHLNSLLPEKFEERKPELLEKAASKVVISMNLEVLKEAAQNAIRELSSEFPVKISNINIEAQGEMLRASFEASDYNTTVNMEQKGMGCDVSVFASKLSSALEIASLVKYFLDSKHALKSIFRFEVEGIIDKKELLAYARSILMATKRSEEGLKIAHYLDTLAEILSKQLEKDLKQSANQAKKLAEMLKEIYVAGSKILSVDSEKVINFVNSIIRILGDKN